MMRITSRSTARRTVAALAFALLAASPQPAHAFVSEGGKLHSGLFGLTWGQVAQLNIAHFQDPNEACAFEVVAIDAGGRTIKRTTARLTAGQSARIDLPYAALAATPADDSVSGRKRLRLEIKGSNPQPDPPGCVATLEVYDGASGATRVVIGSPDIIPVPPG